MNFERTGPDGVDGGQAAVFPAPLRDFVELFNRREFWESHEVLEKPWRSSRSGFYHGLILYASAFVHAQRRNPRGVIAQLRKTETALEPYEPYYLGIGVREILGGARRLRERVEDRRSPLADPIADYPTLGLDMALLLGTEPELAPE